MAGAHSLDFLSYSPGPDTSAIAEGASTINEVAAMMTRLSPMRFTKIAGLILSAGLSACSSAGITVDLASKAESLPQPSFKVSDASKEGQKPVYSRLRVFDVTDGCLPPKCPLLWHVVTRPESSPEGVTYGALPGFGTLTVDPPHDLQEGRTYELIVDQPKGTPSRQVGTIRFHAGPDNRVTAE